MKTGIIGLGAMGTGMAGNLARAGHLVAVWNRTRSKAEAFAAGAGVDIAEDPADLARRAELVITCVSRDADLEEVVDALLPGLGPDAVVVDTSTVAADTARSIYQRLAMHGGDFLDAPVSGGAEGARNGTLAMMVGGDAAVLERVRPALEAIARRIVHLGPCGNGQATKAVNQIMAAGINQAVTEALAFGQAAGLPMEQVIEVVSGGAAGNWFLEHRGRSMLKGSFEPGFKVALHHKDLGICAAMARSLGIEVPFSEVTREDYDTLMDHGYGEEDISALYRLKRPARAR
jgi:3-hydroxyisobutyrate dehydrogenase